MNGSTIEKGTYQIGMGAMYLCLVIETVMFVVIYMKRLFQLAYLTMVAPIVAFMYPLDKVGDGKAQAFNTWLKDYIFNALLQPLHLLLYTVFIAAASDLFSKNIIYALVIYGFMIPAEKYFKKLLGFDKASTGGGGPLGGAIGGPMAMEGFRALTGLGPGGRGGKGGSGSGGSRKNLKLKRRSTTPRTDSDESGGSSSSSSSNASGSSTAPAGSQSGTVRQSGQNSSGNNGSNGGNRGQAPGADNKKKR